MSFRFFRTVSAVITAAALAAVTAVPSFAAAVEGKHAADLAAVSADETYGPGIGLESGGQNRTAFIPDLAVAPAGLDQDLWDEARKNVQMYSTAAEKDLEGVNALRASVGQSALVTDPLLTMIAAYRAAEMLKYRHLSHYTPEGEYLAVTAAKAATGEDDIWVYENFYYECADLAREPFVYYSGGNAGASAALQQGPEEARARAEAEKEAFAREAEFLAGTGQEWLTASPAHYENMTRPGHTQAGIGFALSPAGEPVLDVMIQMFR